MHDKVVARKAFIICEEDDIILTRQAIREIAGEWEFGPFATSALITIASELTRNMWVYAGKGEVCLEIHEERFRIGLLMRFIDQGPGITNIERVLAGGYSQAGSLGLGLSGSKRLSDEFEIRTTPGEGTHITAVKWRQRP